VESLIYSLFIYRFQARIRARSKEGGPKRIEDWCTTEASVIANQNVYGTSWLILFNYFGLNKFAETSLWKMSRQTFIGQNLLLCGSYKFNKQSSQSDMKTSQTNMYVSPVWCGSVVFWQVGCYSNSSRLLISFRTLTGWCLCRIYIDWCYPAFWRTVGIIDTLNHPVFIWYR
jgi:hypothetical protein